MKNVLLIYADMMKIFLSRLKNFIREKSLRKINFPRKIADFELFIICVNILMIFHQMRQFPFVFHRKMIFSHNILFFQIAMIVKIVFHMLTMKNERVECIL